jgi:hypothetical protein
MDGRKHVRQLGHVPLLGFRAVDGLTPKTERPAKEMPLGGIMCRIVGDSDGPFSDWILLPRLPSVPRMLS